MLSYCCIYLGRYPVSRDNRCWPESPVPLHVGRAMWLCVEDDQSASDPLAPISCCDSIASLCLRLGDRGKCALCQHTSHVQHSSGRHLNFPGSTLTAALPHLSQLTHLWTEQVILGFHLHNDAKFTKKNNELVQRKIVEEFARWFPVVLRAWTQMMNIWGHYCHCVLVSFPAWEFWQLLELAGT